MGQITWEEISESNKNEIKENTQSKESEIYLIFKINSEYYAIKSDLIKEIIRNNELFPIPFAPDYIKGVLNYYGTPYATVDYSVLTGNTPVSKRLFMVLNDDNEVALQISDMIEFKNENELAFQSSENENKECLTGIFSYDDVNAKILDIESILKKVKADLENK